MNEQEKKAGLTIAIIPARGGSKEVPGKNLKILHNSPLIAHTIRAARRVESIDRVIVSSDDEEILAVSRANGAEAIQRPEDLATDESPTEPALEHVVKTIEESGEKVETVLLLQCTSPLRNDEDIDHALRLFNDTNADSLLSVCTSHAFFWKREKDSQRAIPTYDYKKRPRRQDMKEDEVLYRENGAIYITRRDVLMNEHNRLGGNIVMFVMEDHFSMEIDSEFDFWLASEIMKGSRHSFIRKHEMQIENKDEEQNDDNATENQADIS